MDIQNINKFDNWTVRTKIKGEITEKKIIDTLLKNRGLKTDSEIRDFFDPKDPMEIPLKEFGIESRAMYKAITRLKKAKKNNEEIVVYGDYDADGICAAAILWETLYKLGFKALPYIPERFSEGYGINIESIKKIRANNSKVKLIITVDNGIVANKAVSESKKLGIDVIITDHHRRGAKKPNAYSIIHTTKIGGAGISWVFSREIIKKFQIPNSLPRRQAGKFQTMDTLELAAIGTISDQIPLIGSNRSFVKYGLMDLNKTKRPGLTALFQDSSLKKGEIGVYEIGFVIAPRINAAGRLTHAVESLRLLCTNDKDRAYALSRKLSKINKERQDIVEEVVVHTRKIIDSGEMKNILVVSGADYHEGVIGLVASKLVEEYNRPAIVLSQGEKISKASARSINGFNIIEAITKTGSLIREGGGHPMAAGFSIETEKISLFIEKLLDVSSTNFPDEIFEKNLKADIEIGFDDINWKLVGKLNEFEPSGIGNSRPLFISRGVKILALKNVGRESKHLSLKLMKDDKVFSAIGFNLGDNLIKLLSRRDVDIAYTIKDEEWQGTKNIKLFIKDMKIINQ